MPTLVKAAATLAIAVALALSATMMLAPEPSTAATYPSAHGCPFNAFCIYPHNAGWNGNHPSNIYYRGWRKPYTTHTHRWYNLHNQYGMHKIFNNAFCSVVSLNKGSNGGGPYSLHLPWLYDGHSRDVSLTPVNSVTIWLDWSVCGPRP